MNCWTYCSFFFLLGTIDVESFLQIRGSDFIPAIHLRPIVLPCHVTTDRIVKQVKWYKVSPDGSSSIIYYYEPPTFNMSSGAYKGRAFLDEDGSSLQLTQVRREDDGQFECRVEVTLNTTLTQLLFELPQQRTIRTSVAVYVPPSEMKLSAFASGSNLTFTCRSLNSKPAAKINWVVTERSGARKEIKSSKVVSEVTSDDLETAVGYLYWTVTSQQAGSTVECVVTHPQTLTTLADNITLVAPVLRHPVNVDFDMLGTSLPYATYESEVEDEETGNDTTAVAGLVTMQVSPAVKVVQNASVLLTIRSAGAFPAPSFNWWSEHGGAMGGGDRLRIVSLRRSQTIFCMVESPFGRVVMSVDLKTASAGEIMDDEGKSSGLEAEDEVLMNGVLLAAILMGSLLVIFLLAFLIYFFACKKPADKLAAEQADVEDRRESDEDDDFDPYVLKKAPSLSQLIGYDSTKADEKPSAKVFEADEEDGGHAHAHEKSALLTSSDRPPTPTAPSTTKLTSDDDDDDRQRPIARHLQDFDENASFVGEYGSTFALDDVTGDGDDVTAPVSPYSDVADDRRTEASTDSFSETSAESATEGNYPVSSQV